VSKNRFRKKVHHGSNLGFFLSNINDAASDGGLQEFLNVLLPLTFSEQRFAGNSRILAIVGVL
jgi:hypothetical protein